MEALADSLRPVADNAAGNRRILRLIARQLEDIRAQLELTPEQRERLTSWRKNGRSSISPATSDG